MAWALSQVVAVGLAGSGMVFYEPTEQYVSFYDIFTRNAFGNYRDIMKEFSFNKIMAEWLSFKSNKSLQYNIDTLKEANYPDENFAREIMQLFSIGLYKLNPDGSFVLENGNPVETYTIDDIVSYSKTWTGFSGRGKRGGTSTSGRQGDDSLDPMQIVEEYRDLFPKSNLEGGFIGDRSVPLCTDLPPGHALRKGAVWKLLSSSPQPEYQEDPNSWGPETKRLELDPSSALFDKLCSPNLNGDCTFPSKIVLDENIYDSVETGVEYTVDTIRTVQLKKAGLSTPIFYEYIRQPCVELSFFSNAVKLMQGEVSAQGVQGYPSMCGDPRLPIATPMCCSSGWETNAEYGHIFCNYQGERMSYDSAQETCSAMGEESCQPGIMKENLGGECAFGSQGRHFRSWTPKSCELRAKIDFSSGYVAIVHAPEPDFAGQSNIEPMVDIDTLNYFKVAWEGAGFPSSLNECLAVPSCTVHGGNSCICSTDVSDQQVFSSATEVTSAVDLMAALHTGAVDPAVFDAGAYQSLGNCNIDGVDVYTKAGGACSSLSFDTIFALEVKSKTFYLKNSKSAVHLSGTSYSFRNPVQFNNLADPEVRDMYWETDEVIDSLFYYPSHAPFLAYRIIQRFGISNPSPSFIERVVSAYSTGSYQGFGSGKYGDLGAMVAAALLDDESRKVVLDADQSHGQLREPLLKVFGLLRAMKADLWAPLSVPLTYAFIDIDIGQGPYRSPSVFSFFKPEFMTGSLSEIGLVAPEAEVLQGGLITSLMDGMWSMMKFGLSHCYGGFQEKGWGADCPRQEGVSISDATATLTYEADPTASLDEVLNELALILTAGRLSESNRIIVRNAMQSTFSGNRAKAVRIAVQLIVSSPEFHSTNVARKTGVPMQLSGYTSDPVEDYKAIVYYYMGGGVDSFNVLVPMSNCKDGRNMYQEYRTARGSVALGTSDLLDIDTTGSNQICDTFAVNKNYAFIQELYNAGKGLFVANAGVLNKPLTKHDNYEKDSKVQLFAHNHMTSENLKCDINDDVAGTGVGGRILDMLKRQGYQTSSNSVDAGEKMLKGFSLDNNPVWSVPLRDPTELDQYSSVGSSMLDLVKNLNGVGTDEDGFLGSTWSVMTSKALFEYEKSLEHAELFKSPEFDMSHYPETLDRTHNRFRSLAQYMKMRTARKVNREVFMLRHEGFDSHSESKDLINDMFGDSDKAIRTFVGEMERQGIWNNVVIVMGSEFGRSVSPNSNSGTDHGWGGNYFVLGGSLKGKQILGQYPEYLSKESDQWMSRGRIIPTTPWEYVWHGIAQWMGVLDSNDLSEILPNMKNFRKCDHFTDKDLFVDGQVPTYDCANMDEDNDGVIDDLDLCPGTLQYFVDNGLVDGNGCSGSFSPSSSSSPTISPTDEPTSNPTLSVSPTSSTLPFQDIGNNGLPAEVFPLGQCQGDCDNDIECQEGLLCFQRSNFELVPGCEGGDFDQKTDYCFKPTPNPTNTPTPNPTQEPTNHPIAANPTDSPTPKPTGSPTMKPTSIPTTVEPTLNPTTATPTTHPTTASPTTSPTTALPTTASPTTSTLPLQDIGNNGLPREVFPLGQCQGDCDNDGECQDGLLCLERNNFEQVPGCNGHESDQHTDFCIQRPANYYWFVGNNGVPASAFPMNACDGDCDNDAECAGDLECSPQEGPVPGCFGEVVLGKQYCFDPNPNPSEPTTAQPTNIPTPTGEPSREPTNPPITANPTDSPTPKPTDFPTVKPTPTAVVTPNPTNALTPNPTQDPTNPTLEGEELVYSVFDEGSQVTHVGCTDEHSSSNHVALDHQTEKFFCSKSGSESPGLLVSPSHGKMSLAKGLRVYAHNNCPGCDATSFILEGRKDPSENWAVISQGELSWTSEDRNARGQLISSTYGSGDSNLNYAEVSFPQKIALEYKLTFPTTRQTDEAIIQFAEVELPGKLLENIALQDVGNNGLPAEAFPLGQCQGDCDNDGECQGDLICYQRGNFDWVPGCTGHESNQKTDYCYGRPHENYLWFVGNNGVPASAFPMNACEGDCDNDGECAGELECRSRSGTEAVPGCEGAGISRKDYCYEPNA